jgi:hypothetical protein
MQLVLVVIVIFVPETVTMFLDKEQKVDLDQVTIEMPVQDDINSQDESADKPSAEDEQKKMEELFNVKK